jgi:hypothetical protein
MIAQCAPEELIQPRQQNQERVLLRKRKLNSAKLMKNLQASARKNLAQLRAAGITAFTRGTNSLSEVGFSPVSRFFSSPTPVHFSCKRQGRRLLVNRAQD